MKKSIYIIGIILLLWSSTQTGYSYGNTQNGYAPRVAQYGLNFIKEKEGYRSVAYQDAVNKWTIGYGHTATAKRGMKITPLEGEKLLRKDVRRFEVCVWKKANRILEEHQFAALVSFTYNLGCGVLKRGILKGIRNGNDALVAHKIKLYIYAGGRVLRGLVIRRKEEARFYMGDAEIIKRYSKCKN